MLLIQRSAHIAVDKTGRREYHEGAADFSLVAAQRRPEPRH